LDEKDLWGTKIKCMEVLELKVNIAESVIPPNLKSQVVYISSDSEAEDMSPTTIKRNTSTDRNQGAKQV
jgi:hypothetical protein